MKDENALSDILDKLKISADTVRHLLDGDMLPIQRCGDGAGSQTPGCR
jgi:hypothetical protein